MNGKRMRRADGNIVEKTEAGHWRHGGVMPGRPHGAKGVCNFARHYRVNGCNDRSRCTQRRLAGTGCQLDVSSSSAAYPLDGTRGKYFVDIDTIMHAFDLFDCRPGCLDTLQPGKSRFVEFG